jgi:hypothetical protein
VRGTRREQRQVTVFEPYALSAGDLQLDRTLLDDVEHPLTGLMTYVSPAVGADRTQLSALQMDQLEHVGQRIDGCVERSGGVSERIGHGGCLHV